ncbi:hypothetical protein GGI06_001094 [Coemansia sp. S85]|nr:hypothetical protein GGI06_001094 [Coemansia sp. S85]
MSTFGSHEGGWPLFPQSESFITDTDDDSSSYTTSSTFGWPQFPALTTLVVAYFPKSYNQVLTLFASSPITRFSVLGSSFKLPSSINLSQFRHLRSIEAQIEDELPDYCSTFINKWLSDMLATAGSQLEHLSIMLGAEDGFRLRITAPPAFARNITSLKLDDHIAIDDVGLILQQLPNLIKLELGPRTQVPIYSESELISALRTAEASHQLTPLSTSLKLLRVWRSELCTSQDQFNPNSSSRAYASFFKGMLVELACRLPSLEILRVAVSPIEDIQDAVNLLVDSGIASELIGHLRKLQIRSEAE